MVKRLLLSNIFYLILVASVIAGLPGYPPTPIVWRDVDYTGSGEVFHLMDIYLPGEAEPPYPVIIGIYGSAFMANNLKGAAWNVLGEPLLEEGFAFIAVNHRSSRDAIFPAQINDIKAAVRFLRAKAGQYQLDTSFIGITGYSSGGHLAAMAGTTAGISEYTVNGVTVDIDGSVGKYAGFSSRVHAVVNWYGPTDFLIMDSCGSSMVHNATDSPESLLVGGPIQENPEMCALTNPITYIDSHDPPFLIIHGDADELVPWCQSHVLNEALRAAGVRSEFILVPGAGHGTGLESYKNNMADFFRSEYLRIKAL